MEILLKKSKITASILKQTVSATFSDMKNSSVLGWCIFNKVKYIVFYNNFLFAGYFQFRSTEIF